MAAPTIKPKVRDELTSHFRKRFNTDFSQQNAKAQSIAAARFYIEQIHNLLNFEISEEDIDAGLVDGTNDLGCDFIHRDDGKVVVVQVKYRNRSAAEDPKDISHFKSILKRFADPEQKPNRRLSSALRDIDWDNDSFELIFISFTRMSPETQARKIAEQSPDYPSNWQDISERSDWSFYDEDDLNQLFVEARSSLSSISEKEIALYPVGPKGKRGESVVSISAGAFKSYLMTLDARQIQQAYDQLGKDAIFSLNIRNFIGSTKTNKEIIKTATAEPKDFFLFNNGIACLATAVELNTDSVKVRGLQVINGAQTVKSIIHVAKDINRHKANYWNDGVPQVLVRITEIPNYGAASKIRERITQFNNTQNPVKISDFRSNDRVQASVKEQLEALTRNGKKVVYVAKRTDRIPSNTEVVKLEEFSKSVYTFLHDFVPFSGSTSFLFDDEDTGGYTKIFGDGKSVWTEMPADEFRLRAAIYWIAQEISHNLKRTRGEEEDADARAALERKWALLYAFSIVVKFMYKDQWKSQIDRLYNGNWSMNDEDKKGRVVLRLYNAAKRGLILSYSNAKNNDKSFVHRNWMRSKDTPEQIRKTMELTLLPLIEKVDPIPS